MAIGLLASGAEVGDRLRVASARYEIHRLEKLLEELEKQEIHFVERHPYALPSLDGSETQVVGVP